MSRRFKSPSETLKITDYDMTASCRFDSDTCNVLPSMVLNVFLSIRRGRDSAPRWLMLLPKQYLLTLTDI